MSVVIWPYSMWGSPKAWKTPLWLYESRAHHSSSKEEPHATAARMEDVRNRTWGAGEADSEEDIEDIEVKLSESTNNWRFATSDMALYRLKQDEVRKSMHALRNVLVLGFSDRFCRWIA